jgi:LysR family hydrogen peroxide-inducible transcriptional activator
MALGVMCTIAPVQFVAFLGRFRSDNPGVELTLTESVPDRLCELLIKGEIDVALMARPSGFPAPLEAHELYSEPFVVACAAGHRFTKKDEVAVAELDGEYYFSRINCEFRDFLGDLCKSQGVNLVRSYRSEREDWILTMVAAGLGVCFLPANTAVFPGVVGRRVVAPAVSRNVCLVTVAGRSPSAAVDRFVGAVRRYAWPKGSERRRPAAQDKSESGS